jgi:hypothetical protein
MDARVAKLPCTKDAVLTDELYKIMEPRGEDEKMMFGGEMCRREAGGGG